MTHWHLSSRAGRLLATADDVLRRSGGPASQLDWRRLILVIAVFGSIYGAVMGCSSLDSPERALQVLYSAVKVPMLLGTTTLLCLPAFFVISTVAGVREDFHESLGAIVCSQAVMSVTLAALAPVTAVFYFSTAGYHIALLFNGLIFGVGTLSAQGAIRRGYKPLILRNSRHRTLLWLWAAMYIFVGTQMGWTLRPFVGSPGAFPTFFRDEPFTNAYIEVSRIVGQSLREVGFPAP